MINLYDRVAVIITSQPVSAGMLRYVPKNAYVVAADAGWQNARALGIGIDLVVGDFDSSDEPDGSEETIRLPAEKDDSDAFYALKYVLKYGCRNVVLLGALGGRWDHEYANLQLMLYAAQNNAKCLMPKDGFELRCVGKGEYTQIAAGWKWLSVFAAGGVASGVHLSGVKYPLTNATLTPNTPLGLSNEFAADEARICLGDGYLYVSVSCDE